MSHLKQNDCFTDCFIVGDKNQEIIIDIEKLNISSSNNESNNNTVNDVYKSLDAATQNGGAKTFTLKLLLKKKADVIGKNFNLLLRKGIEEDNDKIVKILIDHGLKYNQSVDFETLNMTVSQENPLIIRAIISHYQLSDTSYPCITKELVIKSDAQTKKCVETLIKWKFAIYPGSQHDEEFVWAVVENGYLQFFYQLLNFRVNVNMVHSKTGYNLLATAIMHKQYRMVMALLKHQAKTNVIMPIRKEKFKSQFGTKYSSSEYDHWSKFVRSDNHFFHVTCLHIAVLNLDPKMVELLLKYDAKVIYDLKLFKITRIAILNSCEKLVRLFIDHGLNYKNINHRGETLLHSCIHWMVNESESQFNITKMLLDKGAKILLQTPKNTLIFESITNGHLKITKMFLNYNPDFQYVDVDGNTPLHKAVELNHDEEFIETLLDFFSSANSENEAETPSSRNMHIDCVNKKLQTPLHIACQAQNRPLTRLLLKKGANPNVADNEGNTPLHYICRQKYNPNVTMIKLLLKHNANIDATNIDSRTPLFMAYALVNNEIIKCLLDNNANPDVKDCNGETALHYVCRSWMGSPWKLIPFLLKNSANVETTDLNSWNTPGLAYDMRNDLNHRDYIHHILRIFEPLPVVLKILLEYNFNFSYIDKLGNSIVHYITSFKIDEKFIEILSRIDINLNLLNNEGKTPLYIAVEKGNFGVVRSLIRHGADINVLDKDKKNPLHNAFESKYCVSEIKDVIREQVVKLKIAQLEVSDRNLNLISDFNVKNDTFEKLIIKCFTMNCEMEIKAMKQKCINVKNMTLYDLLKKNIHSFNKLIEDEDIKQILVDSIYEMVYPLYIHILRNRLRQVKLLQQRKIVAKKYFTANINPQLPRECVQMLFRYFNTEELKEFNNTMKLLIG